MRRTFNMLGIITLLIFISSCSHNLEKEVHVGIKNIYVYIDVPEYGQGDDVPLENLIDVSKLNDAGSLGLFGTSTKSIVLTQDKAPKEDFICRGKCKTISSNGIYIGFNTLKNKNRKTISPEDHFEPFARDSYAWEDWIDKQNSFKLQLYYFEYTKGLFLCRGCTDFPFWFTKWPILLAETTIKLDFDKSFKRTVLLDIYLKYNSKDKTWDISYKELY